MSKPIVVLADLDANYLIPLEDKLTEECCDQIELEIITEGEYFSAFFSSPKEIDTLIISSALYSQELHRHNISNIFVLTEEDEEAKSTDRVTRIFKYASTKEIFNRIRLTDHVISKDKQTQVIAVTSALGGCGKTTVALALAQSLARSYKRVLFISTDMIQSFGYYLQDKCTLPSDFGKVFSGGEHGLYSGIKPYLRNEGFTYLPPTGRTIFSLGLDLTVYNRLIRAARAAKEFDYIIVDTNIRLDQTNGELLNEADKVLICLLQDAYATYKTDVLVQNIDCRNRDKFMFICNQFRRDLQNDYISSRVGGQFAVAEYIDEVPPHQRHLLGSFADTPGIRKLTYVLS